MRPKKYNTEEERKEASRIAQAKWYAKNKEYKAKYYAENKEAIKEYKAKYNAENKEAKKEYDAKHYADVRTHYAVYKHTNSKGDVYIGCGSNLRPYDFNVSSRSKAWHEAFDNDCQIHVLAEFKDRETARELESLMIEEIGLDNLVNIIA